MFRAYLPVEEEHLEHVFEENYRRYRAKTLPLSGVASKIAPLHDDAALC